MKLKVAETAGFCFGVERAVRICQRAAEEHPGCVTFGPIIHNDNVIRALEEKGVRAIHCAGDVKAGDTVIIRSHGIGKPELAELNERGAKVIDATCPDVKKIHRIVESESAAGRFPVIIGQRKHPEVVAISGWCGECAVFETPEEFNNWIKTGNNAKKTISVVFQTTNTKTVCKYCAEIVKKEYTNAKIFDTICNATCKRQQEAVQISRECDAMIVIGGKNSANSLRLAEICGEHCRKVYFVENAEDLDVSAFCTSDTVGITAGASTPAWIIKEVTQKMSEEIRIDDVPAEIGAGEVVPPDQTYTEPAPESGEMPVPDKSSEAAEPVTPEAPESDAADMDDSSGQEPAPESAAPETFEEMLEKSIKTLHTGQKVTGIIAAVTATEVTVDLGTKQSGYIPISEFTDDPNAKVEDIIKIGDSIETFVMRVNDVEGMVMLSKKRLDAIRNWDDIEAARENKSVVEGVVTEENKGGVVVSVKGVRVFVPASQTGLPRNAPMTELVKKTVRLRITEVNQSRRRVVGSIRSVSVEERREKAENVWNDIEVGKRYNGVVKSMTSYGVFVDIGGVDGMIHISELSWTRIKQPSDVMSVGDEVEVYVLSFDKEKKKISLGYKNNEDNPWVKFTTTCHVGDVVNVKIVKMMPFGAFAEILPGVDGLIHISQITDHRIGLPSEVLSEGQQVDVKITEIDHDRQKISLSIRAIIAPESLPDGEYETEDAQDADSAPTVVYNTDSPPSADALEAFTEDE